MQKDENPSVSAPHLCNKTLFIQRIPFEATQEQLQAHFTEYGLVRSCFLVMNRENGRSKGVGYVQFVLEEDARKALSEKQKFQGKTLKLVLAIKKQEKTEAKVEVNKQVRKVAIKKKTEGISFLIESVGVSKASLLEKRLRRATHKPDTIDEIRPGMYRVTYKDADVKKKVLKLHKKNINDTCLSIYEEKTLKEHRLIVRNLAFDATLDDLREVLNTYGSILEINLPVKEDNTPKGFAFVQFLEKESASRAMLDLNGKKIGRRPVALDWCLSRDVDEKSK